MRTIRVAVIVAMIAALGLPPAAGHEPVPDSVPSFNESPGCGDLDGARGPLAAVPGILDLNVPIYGPWADFYGRTVGLAWAQRVVITLPNMVGTPKALWVHQRVLPALQAAIANLEGQDALGNEYQIRYQNTWSWSRYTIPPGRAFSFHAVGAALDLNSNTNPYRADNVLVTDMPAWFVEAWTSAGWCWGGDWQTKKDAMHFSWMGPLYTPGYVMPPPQPPLVAAASFTAEITYDVGLPPASSPDQHHFVADFDRDGAVDVARVEPTGDGTATISISAARHDFMWSDWFAATPTLPTDTTADVAVADLTRDGRPDLVYLLTSGEGKLLLESFELVQEGLAPPSTIATEVVDTPGSTYLFDDHDRDGDTDLYVIRPGSPASLEIWLGPGFSEPLLTATLTGDSSHFALGDRDFDGVPDLYALDDYGTLAIHRASAGFGSPVVIDTGIDLDGESLFVEDLDGDGHPDLMLVDGNGQMRLRRGGASTHEPGIWFVTATHDTNRIAGANRYATAADASLAHHPDPGAVDTVVVTTGAAFPDALSGAAIAARLGAPLLLVAPAALPPETAAELDRLDPSTIVLLGGSAAVSPAVEQELAGYGSVIRLAGDNRYSTAVEVSRHAFPDGTGTVVVATGQTFADALAAGPMAARLGAPVLLTETDRLLTATRDELVRLDPTEIIVLGGESVVSPAVFEEIAALAPTVRVAGHDRYTTAIAASAVAFPDGSDRVYVATGLAFADALSGAAAGAFDGSPILLVPGTSAPASVIAEILRLRARHIVVVGGSSAVSLAVESALAMAGF